MKLLTFILLLPFVTSAGTIYNVGTGSGNLTIDGNVTKYLSGSLIVIIPGSYGTINIQNLTNVNIENGNGAVIMNGGNVKAGYYNGINFTNCSNDTITRNPAIASTVPYGFICQDNGYRPTTISGTNKNMVFEYMSYVNIGDYNIHITAPALTTWKGTSSTLQDSALKFFYCNFDSSQGEPFNVDGAITATGVTGLQKGFEVGYCTFTNCNSGDLCYAGAVDQYKMHDNTFSNINATNNNDNGLFHMVGNGSFYRNYTSNYQGHLIRMWTLSFGTTSETDSVYDNIAVGSRKYSMFEYQSTAQSPANVIAAPNTTFVNMLICNNTGADLNTSHDSSFDACLIDNYTMPTGSTQKIYNNLLINTFTVNGAAGRFLQWTTTGQQDTLLTQGNVYAKSDTAAGFNESTLALESTSPAASSGIESWLIYPYDYWGTAFAKTPSSGAVQYVGATPPPPAVKTPLSEIINVLYSDGSTKTTTITF